MDSQLLLLFLFGLVMADEKLIPDVELCQDLMQKVSAAIVDFQSCSMRGSRPVLICMTCYKEMAAVRKAVNNMEITVDEENVSCLDRYSNKDQLNIFPKSIDNVLGPDSLWSKAQCEVCYDNNNSTSGIYKNETLEFFDLYNDVIDCFDQHYTKLDYHKYDEVINKEDCDACNETFWKTFEYYKNHVQANKKYPNRKVCYDLRDLINATSLIWTEDLKCYNNWRQPYVSMTWLIILTISYLIFLTYEPLLDAIDGLLPQSIRDEVRNWYNIRNRYNLVMQHSENHLQDSDDDMDDIL